MAKTYLEGTYSEVYPNISQDDEGMKRLFKQFSFPGGIPSHVAPETPGSINEGGELGYSLAHAFGAVLDNPDLIAACVVGDGEAETGPLATAWHANKFLNPMTDGAVLPILHLNGYKISNPTMLLPHLPRGAGDFFQGCGWKPYFVEGDEPMTMHQRMADALDTVIEEIHAIQQHARETGDDEPPHLAHDRAAHPQGLDRPEGGGRQADRGQLPRPPGAHRSWTSPEHLHMLEDWLRSYHPEELFDENGKPDPRTAGAGPQGRAPHGRQPPRQRRPAAAGAAPAGLPRLRLDVPPPAQCEAQDMIELGGFVRDVIKLNQDSRNFRVFGPDETMSNRLSHVFEATDRDWNAETLDSDEFLAQDGRVMDSMLSEHMCEGWLEGYLLTGRHGFFNSYEAFIRIVDSMVGPARQVAQGLQRAALAADIASLNYDPRLQRLAAGPQRLHPSGPRLPGPRRQQEGRCGAPVPAPGCQLPALLLRPLHPQPQLCQRHGGLQASPAPVADHGAGRASTAPRASASGSGPPTIRAQSRTWSWPAAARPPRWRPWPPSPSCATTCPN